MSETRLWNDVVREKLARLEADMQLVMVRLDRLEAVQGTGLSVHQALSALDRYEAQEEHDAALVRRIEALERSLRHEVEARAQAEREADDRNIVHEHQNMTFGDALIDEETGVPFQHEILKGDVHVNGENTWNDDPAAMMQPKRKRKWWRLWLW